MDVLTDLPRATSLFAVADRRVLTHWRGIQTGALAFPASIQAFAVWNTGGRPVRVKAMCVSLSDDTLSVDEECTSVIPLGGGEGRILVSFQRLSAVVTFQVLLPVDVAARFIPDETGRRGRMQVLAWLLDTVLDIAPALSLGTSSPGVTMRSGDELTCEAGFQGDFTVGEPVLYRGTCPPPAPGGLFLLSGAWTKRGGFRLSSAGPVLGIVGPETVTSEDTGRASVVRDSLVVGLGH